MAGQGLVLLFSMEISRTCGAGHAVQIVGTTVVLYSCRNQSEDVLYKDQLEVNLLNFISRVSAKPAIYRLSMVR